MCSNGTTEAQVGPETLARRLIAGLMEQLRSERLRCAAAIALGLALASPCVSTGWVADDWIQQLMLRRDGGLPGIAYQPFDLFRFASGDPTQARQLIDQGVFPWWAHPEAVLAFFRPLTSLSHYVDHLLWPDAALPAHLHSLAWYGVLLYVVSRCLKRFEGTPGSGFLALLLYAIDDAHAPTVSWIANRNSILALTLSLPALLFHDDWRRRGRPRSAWLAALSLALGLLAGEVALVTCAYLLAHACFLDRGGWAARVRALWPYALVLIVWRGVYGALGYGALHSGLYVDPLRAPLGFARAAAERFPALALAQLAFPWSDFWELYPLLLPGLRPLILILALCVLSAFLLCCRPLLRRSRYACFWLTGAALAALPMCATFPHDRLLLGVGIGVTPVLAELCLERWRRLREPRALAQLALIASLHLLAAPLALALRCSRVAQLTRLLDSANATLPSGPELAGKTLVLVNPPLDPFAAYLAPYRAFRHEGLPAHLLWLATATSPVAVTRTGESSLVIRPESGFLASASQWMLRSPAEAPRVGERILTDAAEVRVRSCSASGQPSEALVVFREPLDSPGLIWMQWREHGYVPFTPPPLGQSTTLPAAKLGSLLFHG
jgi:hypothetical protein